MTFDHSFASAGSSVLPPRSPSPSACSPSEPKSSAASTSVAEPVVSPVRQFVSELHGFERQLRGAFAAGGRLQAAAIEAQAAEGLSPIAGHQVLSAIAAAQVAIGEALAQTATGHRLTERLGRSLSYDVEAYGETTKPPTGVFQPMGLSLDAPR